MLGVAQKVLDVVVELVHKAQALCIAVLCVWSFCEKALDCDWMLVHSKSSR